MSNAPRGRPPFLWTDSLEDEFCEAIASGKSIQEACAQAGMPSDNTVYRHMAYSETFASKMTKARAAQQDHEADYCVRLADEATIEDWQVAKLRIWARQWRASKLAPKKYGDKVSAEFTGANGAALIPTAIQIIGVSSRPDDQGGTTEEDS